MLISTHQNAVVRNPFRRLLNMGTGTRWRCNSDIVILTPKSQILVTNLHSPPPDRNEEEVLDFRNSVSIPQRATSPQLNRPGSQFPSIWSLEPQYPTRETRIHPSTAQSILLFSVDQCFIIASSPICRYSFPPYILLSLSPDIFSFRKCLSRKIGVGKISVDLDVDRR